MAHPATPPPTAPPVAYSPPVTLPGNPSSSQGDGLQISDQPGRSSENQPDNKTPPSTNPAQNRYVLPPGPLTPESVAASAAAVNPQSRPTLQSESNPGPIAKNTHGTNLVGKLAPDAKLTPFGTYLQQMEDAITSEWYIECDRFQFAPRDSGTVVEITIVINSKGEIEDAHVESSSASGPATMLCVNAIRRPAPYGVWTKEMVALLGDRYTMHFVFYYL